jgi:hypothetical protein
VSAARNILYVKHRFLVLFRISRTGRFPLSLTVAEKIILLVSDRLVGGLTGSCDGEMKRGGHALVTLMIFFRSVFKIQIFSV